jgi:hypothetical protein
MAAPVVPCEEPHLPRQRQMPMTLPVLGTSRLRSVGWPIWSLSRSASPVRASLTRAGQRVASLRHATRPCVYLVHWQIELPLGMHVLDYVTSVTHAMWGLSLSHVTPPLADRFPP